MMYIERNKIRVLNDRWTLKAAELLNQLYQANSKPDRDRIIDSNERYWKLFKEQLKKISYNKCWYSETRNPYSFYHVDHFRPKKKVIEYDGISERDGYWWLTFDPSNYRLAGSVGNIKKGNHFAVAYNKVVIPGSIEDEGYYLLDPTCKEDIGLLNFRQDGFAIESAPEKDEKLNFDRASYTIDKLELNYPDLVESRLQKWQDIMFLIIKVNTMNKEYNKNPTSTKKGLIENTKDEIRKMLAPCAELTATTRACLRSSGEDWAFRILEENIDEKFCYR